MSYHSSLPALSPLVYGAAPDLAARIREAESVNDALRALLDALGPALLLVADDGRPIFVNRRAAQVLAQRDGLAIGPNGLATDSVKTTRALRAAIAGAAARARSSHAHRLALRLAVARPSAQPPWLISILPIVRDGTGGAVTGYAAVSIIECDARPRIDPASAANYFLLTPRETDVAALLAAGRSSREAAKALHIRIGTVRTHLKSLFEKTGARSQTALALKLQAFAISD
ncbi:MAG TPA: helix-turn-helix transcriptional regulator [Steroidobacteraceae bacterium]|nr:helix-turn-helix transcriptional regulator [Steroidobacteraceae bacterium]